MLLEMLKLQNVPSPFWSFVQEKALQEEEKRPGLGFFQDRLRLLSVLFVWDSWDPRPSLKRLLYGLATGGPAHGEGRTRRVEERGRTQQVLGPA